MACTSFSGVSTCRRFFFKFDLVAHPEDDEPVACNLSSLDTRRIIVTVDSVVDQSRPGQVWERLPRNGGRDWHLSSPGVGLLPHVPRRPAGYFPSGQVPRTLGR